MLGNAVGRDNYKYFFTLLLVHVFCAVSWEITAIFYNYRRSVSWPLCLFMLYALGMLFAVGNLLYAHVGMVRYNYTTNELMNKHRYEYLKNRHGYFDNPFNKPTFLQNLAEVYHPDKEVYYTRDDVLNKVYGGKHNNPREAFLV